MGLVCVPLREKKPIMKKFTFISRKFHGIIVRTGKRKERLIMSDLMTFVNRAEFREWLQEHCLTHAGVWLLFGKAGGPKTIKAGEALEGYEPAFTNFQAMFLSVKKTYTRAYFDAKTDAGREKRMAWILERLHKNLKPM